MPALPERGADWLRRLAEVDCPAFGHRRATRPGAEEGPSPLVLAKGEGAEIIDVEGRRYLDLAAGFGAAVLGHGHPAWLAAVQAQLARLVQGLGDVYASDVKVALLERLAAHHPGERPQVLLGQSGSDAVAAALKTATLATGRSAFIAFDGAYHGLGYGPLPACGFKASFRSPFAAQLNPEVHFAPFPGARGARAEVALDIVDQLLTRHRVAGVLVEPILGRGGCVVPPAGFLAELRARAQAHGALLIADEIWTGTGRSGTFTRLEAEGVVPDILCLGKALGGGLPISACIAPAAVMAGWTAHGEVVHTSTHAGAPFACAAALATLDVLESEGLVARAAKLGEAFMARAVVALEGRARDVRGAGLMVGIELADAPRALATLRRLQARGVLALSGGIDGATLTFTPPLTIAEDRWLEVVDLLADCLA
ncbi:MAG: aspartate aminotransferase family protein [Polyangiaceae bacterium]